MSLYAPVGTIQEDGGRTLLCYKWVITSFSAELNRTWNKVGDYIQSPAFLTKYPNVNEYISWNIRLHLKSPLHEGCYKFVVINSSKDDSRGAPRSRLSLLNSKNEKVLSLDKRAGESWLVKQDFLMGKENGILLDGNLTILCEVIVRPSAEEDLRYPSIEGSDALEYSRRIEVCDDLEKLLEDGMASDVTFIVDKQKFRLHKNILMVRSPVFRAMFAHDMQENAKNTVNIKDIKCEVFKEMLRFIYAGRVDGIGKIAGDLLAAADKYAIQGLTIMCEKFLCDNLSVRNVLEYLRLADLNNAEVLKTQAISFIMLNPGDFADNPEFEAFSNSYPELAFDILRSEMRKKAKTECK